MSEKHLHDLINSLEEKSYNQGYRDGWQAAQDATIRSLNEMQKSLASTLSKHAPIADSRNPFRSSGGAAKVYNYLKANPGARQSQIETALGISKGAVGVALWRLKKQGMAKNANMEWRLIEPEIDLRQVPQAEERSAPH